MSYSEKQRQYNDKYDAENMIAYTVKYQRSIYDAVEKAMEKSGMNRNKWTTTAIMEKLERDGFLSEWDVKYCLVIVNFLFSISVIIL